MIEALHPDGTVSLNADINTWHLYQKPNAEWAATELTKMVELIINNCGVSDASYHMCLGALRGFAEYGADDSICVAVLDGLFTYLRQERH